MFTETLSSRKRETGHIREHKETMKTPKDYYEPEWGDAGLCHDWKNHIPSEIQVEWFTFSSKQRTWLSEWGQYLADLEEWE